MSGDGSGSCDLFVSYTRADRAWAEWLAWELEDAGFRLFLQAWDIRAGQDFVHEMQVALEAAERVLVVLSAAYLSSSEFGEAEWRSAFARDPSGRERRLIPVRVADCEPGGLLRTRVYVDLVGLTEERARDELLRAVSTKDLRPPRAPSFPGAQPPVATERPRFPGALPPVFEVPFASNPLFAGRGEALARIEQQFAAGGVRRVVALTGIGGVGKTSLAVEYAYAHRGDYDVAWWARAQEPTTLVGDVAALINEPQLPDRVSLAVDAGVEERLRAARGWLETHERWLVIIDNVEDPALLHDVLPRAGTGHILVTARTDVGWSGVAATLELDVLDRDSAGRFLIERSRDHDRTAAHALADELGELPLALEQAAGYIAESGGLSLARYHALFRQRRTTTLARGRPDTRHDTVATTWSLSLQRVSAAVPAAADLLSLSAFLAPEDIPLPVLSEHADVLSEPLAACAGDPLELADTIHALRRYGLVKASADAIVVHRLLQAVIRDALDDVARAHWAAAAIQLLRAAYPAEIQSDPSQWAICQRLLSHVLAATEQADTLGVDADATSWLLDRSATYLQIMGQPQAARPLFERALAITEAAYGPDHPDVGICRGNLGSVLRALGELAAARSELERALAITEAAHGPDHPDVGTYRGNLGSVLRALGELAAARSEFERALAITEAAYGPDHPDVGIRRNNLGGVLQELGELAAARSELERALAITEAAHGPDHPDVGIRRNNLGGVLQDLGELAAARSEFERALAITEAAYGPDHPAVGICRGNLGSVLQDLGELAAARSEFERALAITEAAYGPDHPAVGICRNNLGSVLQDLGELAAARSEFERALAITEAAYGPDHPAVGICRSNLGSVLQALGDQPQS